jgi:hypothetical protein
MQPERIYCLALCAEWGTVLGPHGDMRCWLLLNRQYRPFGTGITHWVDYATCLGTRVWLTESQVERLTCESGDCWGYLKAWLYTDATRPEKSKAHRVAYEARVALLGEFGDINGMEKAS